MPVAMAQKVQALRVDFRSAAQLADLLGVSRSQVTRWLKGEGIDPLNAERVDLLELLWSNLCRIYDSDAALEWLLGLNPMPRRPQADRSHPGRARGGADARHPRRAVRLVRVILHRCFAWDERARASRPDGPLWFPRLPGRRPPRQPRRYGCLYLADREVSRSSSSSPASAAGAPRRCPPARGLPLALAALELPDDAELVDLDDPAVLTGTSAAPLPGRHPRPGGHPTAGALVCTSAPGRCRVALVVGYEAALGECHPVRSRGLAARAIRPGAALEEFGGRGSRRFLRPARDRMSGAHHSILSTPVVRHVVGVAQGDLMVAPGRAVIVAWPNFS